MINKEELTARVRSALSEQRFAHTLTVARSADILAERYGIDRELMWITAMLHNIAWDIIHYTVLFF